MVVFIIVQNLVEIDAVALTVLVRLSSLINHYISIICSLLVHLVVVLARSTNIRSHSLQFPPSQAAQTSFMQKR